MSTGDDSLRLRAHDALAAAESQRGRTQRRRTRLALAVPITITLTWLVVVAATGRFGRVADNLVASVTMVFGSLVAGSTPQGGGAVAFPVFTKVLDVPAEVARTFSLSIQTVGMGAASLTILLRRRPLETRALTLAAPAAMVGLLVGLGPLADGELPFRPPILPGPYVKVTFTVMLVAMASAMWVVYRDPIVERRAPLTHPSGREAVLLVVAGFAGGIASSLTGSGADVVLFIALVVLLSGSSARGLPTSVILMALLSSVSFVVLGLLDGQLDVTVAGETVTHVGGEPVRLVDGSLRFAEVGDPAPATRFDLFGLWLAAVPVVAWGAPAGAWIASRFTDRRLARLVVALASLEVVTTVIFLPELHSDLALIAYFCVGTVVASAATIGLRRRRRRVFGQRPVDDATRIGGELIDVDERLGRRADHPAAPPTDSSPADTGPSGTGPSGIGPADPSPTDPDPGAAR